MRGHKYCLAGLVAFFIAAPVIANNPPPDEDFAPWLSSCRNRILKAAGPDIEKRFSKKKRFSCCFSILADGSPADIKLQLSSGDSDADNAVLLAIKKAAPYSVCPIAPIDRTIGVSFSDGMSVYHYQARIR